MWGELDNHSKDKGVFNMGKVYVTKKKKNRMASFVIGMSLLCVFMVIMYMGNQKIMVEASDVAAVQMMESAVN